jgi:hypothetical protein
MGTAALLVVGTIATSAQAQHHEARRRDREPQPIVFTVDVAEDLTGKFVPTFVKPEHTQPERGSFFVTEGIEGSGTVARVVTGGAGNYAGLVGEPRQTFLGFNRTGGVNLRVTFILRPVTD